MSRVPLRVVCHAIIRIDFVPSHLQKLEMDIRRRCAERGAQLAQFVVDFGTPKQAPYEYPALEYLRGGSADALLILRVPLLSDWRTDDLLASTALADGQPMRWLTVPELRSLALLPGAIGPRSFARLRAVALRERKFPMDVIARWLDSEGYGAPINQAGHWTRRDVMRLLREENSADDPQLDHEADAPHAVQ